MPISPEKMKLYPGGSIRSQEWRDIRERIRKRAHDKCEACGIGNHHYRSTVDDQTTADARTAFIWEQLTGVGTVTKIICTVAHMDGGLDDHSDDNLKFLCQRCHLRHDRAQHAESARKTREQKTGQIALDV